MSYSVDFSVRKIFSLVFYFTFVHLILLIWEHSGPADESSSLSQLFFILKVMPVSSSSTFPASQYLESWELRTTSAYNGMPSFPAYPPCISLCWVIIQLSHSLLCLNDSKVFIYDVISLLHMQQSHIYIYMYVYVFQDY